MLHALFCLSHAAFCLVIAQATLTQAFAAELRIVGILGNSGDDQAHQSLFEGAVAPGMGPVLDAEGTLWERGGSKQLLRYAVDGRVLARLQIPESVDANDQLTLAGNTLVMKIRHQLYFLPLQQSSELMLRGFPDSIERLSSSSYQNRVVILKQKRLYWLDPISEKLEEITQCDAGLQSLHVASDGQVFGFGGGNVYAWKNGVMVEGFPRPFHGERPQKLGRHWYAHTWHGTIHRMNDRFEPDPGVVLGGASGSFIGYLPQSAELTNGRGIAALAENLFAVSGMGGVVQLITWNHDEQRFKFARRLGALQTMKSVAIDPNGTIWTGRGSWRWNDNSERSATEGDREPDILSQAMMLDSKRVCVLKKHYSYVQLASGPAIDESGWARLDSQVIKDFELDSSVSGATVVSHGGQQKLIFVQQGRDVFSMGINAQGQMLSPPVQISIPGLTRCTSLAWLAGVLYAADHGELILYRQTSDSAWQEIKRVKRSQGDIHIHSDGKSLVLSDTHTGNVTVLNASLQSIAQIQGLLEPQHVAISGERAVVYEAGRQRLVKLQLIHQSQQPSPVAIAQASSSLSIVHRPSDLEFIDLSRPGGIPCFVAVTRDQKGLSVSLRTLHSDLLKLTLGVANSKSAFIFIGSELRHSHGQYDLRLPAGDWDDLRLAIAIELPKQQERFGFVDHQPIHSSFSPSSNDWQQWDFESTQEQIESRRQQIQLSFDQPQAGKATIVIENSQGKRVRNLFAGREFSSGKHIVTWDGLDDQGRLVAPGDYRWRGITHQGLRPVYRMNFANGDEATVEPWGPNHSTLQDATANSKQLFFAAPVTEGGWALMALDNQGRWVQGFEHQHGFGIQRDAIAADDQYLYCAQDGFAWGGTHGIDHSKKDWTATWNLTLVRYDIGTGKLVEFADKQRGVVIDSIQVGPGSQHPDLNQFNLSGMAIQKGLLYIGSRDKAAVFVVDSASGKRIRTISLPGIRKLAVGDRVYAATDQGIVTIDHDQVVPSLPWSTTNEMDLAGIAIAASGDIWVSDRKSHQLHQLSSTGQRMSTMGTPGGPYKGAYDPQRLVNPAGIAFGPDGKLWVTEDRWNPKRISAWDLSTQKVVYEKFGMPHYGGDGSGFDPLNPRRWIGLGCFWDVDLDKQTARPTHVLSVNEGHLGKYHPHSYSLFREAGRTFVCARGKIALISEVLPDGTWQDRAAISGTHHFAYAFDWEPPQSYIDAFYDKWPEKRVQEQVGRKGEGKPWAQRGMGVLWVDQNGDGLAQQAEFDFCGDQIEFAGGAWGHLQNSLTLTVPIVRNQQVECLRLVPYKLHPSGTLSYPTLEEALTQTIPLSLTPGYKRSGVATCIDRFGRLVFNSDPEMNAYQVVSSPLHKNDSKLGALEWSFPNQWSDVHGSHDAPLPEPGVMQGVLAILGNATLDDQSDVIFLNGNHGRCFVMTTDGLYLDEAFVDVRVSYLKNEYRLGGEIFGGAFGRSEVDGKYYVQIGHGPYRIYELTGLNSTKRMEGAIHVSADQMITAEQSQLRRVAANHEPKEATIPGVIQWNKSGKFKAEVELNIDTDHLVLVYRVEDRSPWINQGRDWAKLFATGDTVDMQFSTEPDSNPQRRSPMPGDKRIVVGPFGDRNVAVLYDYRNPAGTEPMEFTSPWRGEKVDHVTLLTNAKIEVIRNAENYQVQLTIPWSDLGWKLQEAEVYQADFGVTYGDAAGTDTNLRSYWSSSSTGLVDDIPGEVTLTPNLWGKLRLTPAAPVTAD